MGAPAQVNKGGEGPPICRRSAEQYTPVLILILNTLSQMLLIFILAWSSSSAC